MAVVRAPGGGLVVVKAPLDLSKAETLSPRWERERKETRPTKVELPPDSNDGSIRRVTAPILTVVGTELVHGESVPPTLRRLTKESADMVNAALASTPVAMDFLEGLKRPAKEERKVRQETPKQKRERAEMALGFKNKSDDFVRSKLLGMGRKKSDVEKYIRERHGREQFA